jgi:hypothetical protein
MGLLEDLGNESNFPTTRRAWCTVCEMIKKVSPAEAKLFNERLANKTITHTSLSLVLKKNGFDISDSTIGRHRRGVCQGVAK